MNKEEIIKEIDDLINFRLGISYRGHLAKIGMSFDQDLTDEQKQEREKRYRELLGYIKMNLK